MTNEPREPVKIKGIPFPAPQILAEQLASLFQSALLVIVVFTAIASISELAARETVLTLLNARIASLKSDYVEQSKSQPTGMLPLATEKVDPYSKRREHDLEQIQFTEDLKRTLQTLIALGSDNKRLSLRSIQREFNRILESPANPVETPTSFLYSLVLRSSETLLLLSSDHLLAIAIIACGAIGSMISSLRSGKSMSLRSFVLGLASGFVAYLAIKGGKHLFLLQAQGDVIAFNPYGCCAPLKIWTGIIGQEGRWKLR